MIYFNFIMILFYYVLPIWEQDILALFQFHYDLILFILYFQALYQDYLFQFHYDLILFMIASVTVKKVYTFQFHYDLILF